MVAWQEAAIGMTSLIESGQFLNRFFPAGRGGLARGGSSQPSLHQCSDGNFAQRVTLAGFADRLRRLEEHPSAQQALIADKGYDGNAGVQLAQAAGMEVVIPPKSHREDLRSYDDFLYQRRHLVEDAFLCLKQWRGEGRLPLAMPSALPPTSPPINSGALASWELTS